MTNGLISLNLSIFNYNLKDFLKIFRRFSEQDEIFKSNKDEKVVIVLMAFQRTVSQIWNILVLNHLPTKGNLS